MIGLQVAPLPRSSRPVWVAFSGCPEFAPLLLSRGPNPRVAPLPRTFGGAGDGPLELPRTSMPSALPVFSEVPGYPGGSRPLQLRPRYSPQVALRPASPALPVIDRRVASILASFGGAGCEIHRVAPAPCASGIADDQYPGCPEILILRHRLTTVRVTSDHPPSGSPRLILRVAPESSTLATATRPISRLP